jgi:hypothetical protein
VALGNTPNRETSISVEASKSYAFGVRFVDTEDIPISVEGAVVRFVATEPVYQGASEVLNIEARHVLDTAGFVQFEFQAEDLALDPGSYAYDITLIPESGYSTPLLKGSLNVGLNTDTDISNVYTGLNVGSDVTVTLSSGDIIEIVLERVDGLYLVVTRLIEDFTEDMEEQVALAAAEADRSTAEASRAELARTEMTDWLAATGFPFWKGTQAEYNAIDPKNPQVLYLIVDPGV